MTSYERGPSAQDVDTVLKDPAASLETKRSVVGAYQDKLNGGEANDFADAVAAYSKAIRHLGTNAVKGEENE